MKILILDREPARLAAWLTQISRPGRTCHLANTAEQARYMLMSDPYDLVCLEPSEAPGSDDDLSRVAAMRNPSCRVIDLPYAVGLDGLRASNPAKDQQEPATVPSSETDKGRPKWRRLGNFSVPETAAMNDPDGGDIRWRAFRMKKPVRLEPEERFSPVQDRIPDRATDPVPAPQTAKAAQIDGAGQKRRVPVEGRRDEPLAEALHTAMALAHANERPQDDSQTAQPVVLNTKPSPTEAIITEPVLPQFLRKPPSRPIKLAADRPAPPGLAEQHPRAAGLGA
ncbi:MAG: hypothetical protein AAF689_15175 [Pseudomonadota bacterium]